MLISFVNLIVSKVGDLTFQICKKYIDDIIIVNNDEVCQAIQNIYNENRTIVEPSGALALAGIFKYNQNKKFNKNHHIVSILSTSNMDFKKLRIISDQLV